MALNDGVGGILGLREDAFSGSFWPLPGGNRILLSIKVLSFAAAAASLKRPGQAGTGRIGEARTIYSLQGSSSQPLEMFTH